MRPAHLIGMAALSLMWGASFMFIKVMLEEVGPVAVAWLRLGGGAALILALVAARRSRLPARRRWGDLVVVAFFATAAPFVLIPWGERQITSGLAAILNASTPFFAALFAHVALSAERLTRWRSAGLIVGFVGVVVVIGDDLVAITSEGTMGQLAVVVASACYGVGAVYMRRRLLGTDPAVIAGMQGGVSFAMLTPLLLAVEGVPPLPDLSQRVLLSAAGLAFLSSGVALILYYWLLSQLHAAQAALVTYLVPVTALLWGWIVLGERISLAAIPGLALILAGIALVNRRPRPRGRPVPAAAAPVPPAGGGAGDD
ncbi:MAG: DMT family transporter [Chloroflexi bacterium]|nr:DMT family transporter [Chloroflexota bacterium]